MSAASLVTRPFERGSGGGQEANSIPRELRNRINRVGSSLSCLPSRGVVLLIGSQLTASWVKIELLPAGHLAAAKRAAAQLAAALAAHAGVPTRHAHNLDALRHANQALHRHLRNADGSVSGYSCSTAEAIFLLARHKLYTPLSIRTHHPLPC
eukprot:1189415-Prorocentrum_minimum.AAC.9